MKPVNTARPTRILPVQPTKLQRQRATHGDARGACIRPFSSNDSDQHRFIKEGSDEMTSSTESIEDSEKTWLDAVEKGMTTL
jgi:hypothetical protein